MLRAATRRRPPGVAAVELALLLPFILVPLLFGLWEIGRLVEIQQIVDNAAREGGRTASTGEYTNAQVQQIMLNYLAAGGVSTNSVTSTVSTTSGNDVSQANPGDPVNNIPRDIITVTLAVPYSNVKWLATNWILPGGTTMNADVTWITMANVPLKISQTIPGAP